MIREIIACFKASEEVKDESKTVSRYFYKRYRSSLLKKLEKLKHREVLILKPEERILMEIWNEDEEDNLNFLIKLVPEAIHDLFPKFVREQVDRISSVEEFLSNETDIRIWKNSVSNEEDERANKTISRLAILDKVNIYRSLPIEILLELTHDLCRLKIREGETIIQQDCYNDDVYILIDGRLEVFIKENDDSKLVGTIHQGETFGEMAFFTREPRTATVTASEDSECFVLKASDLRMASFKHPIILIQMGRELAKRLGRKNLERNGL